MKRTAQDILQDDILRERAATLARAGERLAEALDKLHRMEGEIAAGMAVCGDRTEAGTAVRHAGRASGGWSKGDKRPGEGGVRRDPLQELNRKIRSYNQLQENVRTRYHHLVVIREALGMVHHQRLEEFYRIPPKKKCLPEG